MFDWKEKEGITFPLKAIWKPGIVKIADAEVFFVFICILLCNDIYDFDYYIYC